MSTSFTTIKKNVHEDNFNSFSCSQNKFDSNIYLTLDFLDPFSSLYDEFEDTLEYNFGSLTSPLGLDKSYIFSFQSQDLNNLLLSPTPNSDNFFLDNYYFDKKCALKEYQSVDSNERKNDFLDSNILSSKLNTLECSITTHLDSNHTSSPLNSIRNYSKHVSSQNINANPISHTVNNDFESCNRNGLYGVSISDFSSDHIVNSDRFPNSLKSKIDVQNYCKDLTHQLDEYHVIQSQKDIVEKSNIHNNTSTTNTNKINITNFIPCNFSDPIVLSIPSSVNSHNDQQSQQQLAPLNFNNHLDIMDNNKCNIDFNLPSISTFFNYNISDNVDIILEDEFPFDSQSSGTTRKKRNYRHNVENINDQSKSVLQKLEDATSNVSKNIHDIHHKNQSSNAIAKGVESTIGLHESVLLPNNNSLFSCVPTDSSNSIIHTNNNSNGIQSSTSKDTSIQCLQNLSKSFELYYNGSKTYADNFSDHNYFLCNIKQNNICDMSSGTNNVRVVPYVLGKQSVPPDYDASFNTTNTNTVLNDKINRQNSHDHDHENSGHYEPLEKSTSLKSPTLVSQIDNSQNIHCSNDQSTHFNDHSNYQNTELSKPLKRLKMSNLDSNNNRLCESKNDCVSKSNSNFPTSIEKLTVNSSNIDPLYSELKNYSLLIKPNEASYEPLAYPSKNYANEYLSNGVNECNNDLMNFEPLDPPKSSYCACNNKTSNLNNMSCNYLNGASCTNSICLGSRGDISSNCINYDTGKKDIYSETNSGFDLSLRSDSNDCTFPYTINGIQIKSQNSIFSPLSIHENYDKSEYIQNVSHIRDTTTNEKDESSPYQPLCFPVNHMKLDTDTTMQFPNVVDTSVFNTYSQEFNTNTNTNSTNKTCNMRHHDSSKSDSSNINCDRSQLDTGCTNEYTPIHNLSPLHELTPIKNSNILKKSNFHKELNASVPNFSHSFKDTIFNNKSIFSLGTIIPDNNNLKHHNTDSLVTNSSVTTPTHDSTLSEYVPSNNTGLPSLNMTNDSILLNNSALQPQYNDNSLISNIDTSYVMLQSNPINGINYLEVNNYNYQSDRKDSSTPLTNLNKNVSTSKLSNLPNFPTKSDDSLQFLEINHPSCKSTVDSTGYNVHNSFDSWLTSSVNPSSRLTYISLPQYQNNNNYNDKSLTTSYMMPGVSNLSDQFFFNVSNNVMGMNFNTFTPDTKQYSYSFFPCFPSNPPNQTNGLTFPVVNVPGPSFQPVFPVYKLDQTSFNLTKPYFNHVPAVSGSRPVSFDNESKDMKQNIV